ncbi:MAG: zincin-like metallopeptidase domain-containing protein [Acetobacteraceae bacterium]
MRTKPHQNSNPPSRDHYSEVTDRVIAALEAGTLPWRRPWDPDKASGPGMPCNATTGARYKGINTITLGTSALAFSSGDPRWATYKQAAERGWQVRKGERGTTAYLYKPIQVRDHTASEGDNEATKRIPLLRAFTLFHASQIDGVPDYVPPTIQEAPWRAPDAVETIIANSGAIVRVGGNRAFYSPATDHIQMPPRHAFATGSGWGAVLLHETCHWTGSAARLNRDLRNTFGSHDYSREELRAEIGMAMVCGEIGLAHDFDNTASYLASWLERLKSHRKEIFRAAADAQRIADYLLAFHPDYAQAAARSGGDETREPATEPSASNGPADFAEAA